MLIILFGVIYPILSPTFNYVSKFQPSTIWLYTERPSQFQGLGYSPVQTLAKKNTTMRVIERIYHLHDDQIISILLCYNPASCTQGRSILASENSYPQRSNSNKTPAL